jgi:glycerol kinase
VDSVSVLAIDVGTTGVTALIFTENGQIAAKGYEEFPQHFPEPGWVEHDPEDIRQATLSACGLPAAGRPASAS